MPPRQKRNVPQSQAPMRQTRPRVQVEQEEQFNLDVSGSDDDHDSATNSLHNDVATPANLGVNNPDMPTLRKPGAPDIQYFFERRGKYKVCKECEKAKKADPSNWLPVKYEYSHQTSNTSLRPHLQRHHRDLYLTLAEERDWQIMLPGLVSESRTRESEAATSQDDRLNHFDEQTFHNDLLNFIIADDQSLNVVECPKFRKIFLNLRSDLKETMIPHRTKMRELALRSWKEYFQILRRELQAAVGRVSFTMDMWSNQNRQSYMAITAHWIASIEDSNALKLKTALIAFHRLRGRHDGSALANIVLELLDRVGVTVKIGHFTMDNASNNDSMMKSLAALLAARDIPFDAKDRRVMCFAHIIDLCSGRVIKSIDKSDDLSDDDETLITSNPIACARSAVKVIRASGQRREAFSDVITHGNAKGWFKEGDPPQIIQLELLELLRDVRTRWDSVYHMLNRLRVMRPAVDHYFGLPNNSDLTKYKILPSDWAVMKDVEVILCVTHKVQTKMSGESIPILSGAIPSFENFMTTWEDLSKKNPKLKPMIKPGLDLAVKYYRRMDRTTGYIIAMMLNPAMRMSWIKDNWGEDYIDIARNTVQKLMNEYREKSADNEERPAQADDVGDATCVAKKRPAYIDLAAEYGINLDMDTSEPTKKAQTVKDEYDAYIGGPLLSAKVDIIKFWEMNHTTFPTLFSIAMDYLPIQASSVPCERIFSSSAETDTKRRNRMKPLLMEALQMLKFHLKKERLNFTKAWMTSKIEMMEDHPDEDLLLKLLQSSNFQDGLDRAIKNCIDSTEDIAL